MCWRVPSPNASASRPSDACGAAHVGIISICFYLFYFNYLLRLTRVCLLGIGLASRLRGVDGLCAPLPRAPLRRDVRRAARGSAPKYASASQILDFPVRLPRGTPPKSAGWEEMAILRGGDEKIDEEQFDRSMLDEDDDEEEEDDYDISVPGSRAQSAARGGVFSAGGGGGGRVVGTLDTTAMDDRPHRRICCSPCCCLVSCAALLRCSCVSHEFRTSDLTSE